MKKTEKDQLTSLRKNIWKYYGGSVFIREGSFLVFFKPNLVNNKIQD